MTWKTKPSDRFVLRWIKMHLSAPVSRRIVSLLPSIRPSVVTICSAAVGLSGGVAFGIGLAWLGGLLAAVAQVLDGVDGQVARLTGRESPKGAFLDSVLDRYVDFSLLFGMLVYGLRFSSGLQIGDLVLGPVWIMVLTGLAAAGSSQVSYTTARASALKLDYPRPELAGKGTRTTVIILCGLLSPLWPPSPCLALLYLALHSNLAIVTSLLRTR